MDKKQIEFSVPIGIEQRVKVRDGVLIKKLEWDIFTRLYKWLKSLFPRIVEVEEGSRYATVQKSYFWVDSNGEFSKRELPKVNIETEELVIKVGMFITTTENLMPLTNNTIVDIEM